MRNVAKLIVAFAAGIGVATLVRFNTQPDESQVCTVPQGPITAPGNYCLDKDLAKTLMINSSDVALDLRTFCIRSSEGPKSTSSGIELGTGASRITITNGCIDGFLYGIRSEDPAATEVHINRVALSNQTFRGISLRANDVSIVENVISNVQGTKVFHDAYAMGVEIHGRHCIVKENIINNVYPTGDGEGVGISISDYQNNTCLVTGNTIRNEAYPKRGRTFGVWSLNESVISDNIIVNMTYAIAPKYSRGNYVIDEACAGLHFASSNDDDFDATTSRVAQCQDNLEIALARFDPTKKGTAFRIGQIYEMQQDYVNAMVYYSIAENLGSKEAKRLIEEHIVAYGRLTQREMTQARLKGRSLMTKHAP
ncbi:hypothetical protein [Achromobacter xylosoxidans]|uniref:hypothetical protein n=1 Tax=Alcaligenes xylosoxydans xylosoxydans TaxID=85698 RepID=UPI001EEE92E8|nr:hypothetical protein [Achromobacter xylosoxidans]MEC6412189.1 hypothetical protein [Achromobacter xylosoxidans]